MAEMRTTAAAALVLTLATPALDPSSAGAQPLPPASRVLVALGRWSEVPNGPRP